MKKAASVKESGLVQHGQSIPKKVRRNIAATPQHAQFACALEAGVAQ